MDAVDALKQGLKVAGIPPRKLNGQDTPDWQTQDDARWWAADAAADPVAWQAHLENLWHYDLEYPYDPCHLYDDDRTTDPDYGVDGVHLMAGDVHLLLQAEAHRTLKSIFGDRYITELAMKPSTAYAEQLQAVGRRYGFAAVRFAPDIAVVHRPWRHSTRRGPTGRARTGSRCSTWIASRPPSWSLRLSRKTRWTETIRSSSKPTRSLGSANTGSMIPKA